MWSTDPVWQANVNNASLTDAQTQYHYLHTDHLGTPQLATTKEGQTSWKAQSEAFGAAGILQGQTSIEMNLRFPGQYYDTETNSHYNFHRDYKPNQGRYVQSDPIGLDGGINLFGYATANPLIHIDDEGLANLGPWPREKKEKDDYSACAYYDDIVSRFGCAYHANASQICRANAKHRDAVLENIFLRSCSFASGLVLSGDYAAPKIRNCIRRCLVKEDSAARNREECLIYDKEGCIKRACIDEYHNKCFVECGVSNNCYGGNWPYQYTADD